MYDRLRRELSYAEGLLEGSTAANNPDRKALLRLIGVLDELVEATQKLDTRQGELEEYAEAIDEDLNDLELLIYEDDDDDSYVITCQECGEEVVVDLDDLDDEEIELICPNCHTLLVVDEDESGKSMED